MGIDLHLHHYGMEWNWRFLECNPSNSAPGRVKIAVRVGGVNQGS